MGNPDGSMPSLLPENSWRADPALRAVLTSWLRPQTLAWSEPALIEMGRAAVDELQDWGDLCERQPTVLQQFDGWGDRVDEVRYPPAWRALAAAAARAGLVAAPYETETLARTGAEARLVQAALCYLFSPSTATHLCPVAMTDGAARALVDGGGARAGHDAVRHLISRDPASAWASGQWMHERPGRAGVGMNA